MKPLNTAASWKAAKPFLSFAAQPLDRQQQEEAQRTGKAPIVDSCIPAIPEVPKPELYRRAGVLTGQYSLELQKVFAVVELGGTQFKVTPDDVFFVSTLHGTDVNDVLELSGVMLLGSRGQTVIGRPYVPGASVLVAVEEHFRDGKVHVFKRNPRKRYRKYMTTRPHLTTLRVLEVRGIEPAPGDLVMQAPLPIAWGTDLSHDDIEEAQEQRAMLAGAP